MLVIQIDSRGTVDVDVHEIVRHDRAVEGAGGRVGRVRRVAQAKGGATLLLQASHRAFVANGAVGRPGDPVRLDEPDDPPTARGRRRAGPARRAQRSRSRGRGAARPRNAVLGRRSRSALGMRRRRAADARRGRRLAWTARRWTTAAGEVTLDTAKVIGEGRDRRRQPNQDVVFDGMGLGAQLQHGADPPVGRVLPASSSGSALIVFEFFAISIGLVGLAGAIAHDRRVLRVLAPPGALVGRRAAGVRRCSGLSIDVQAGGLGSWTVIGTVSLVVGSCLLYGGSSSLDVPVVGAHPGDRRAPSCSSCWGMTAAVRARFSTPTVGREGMIGEDGDGRGADRPRRRRPDRRRPLAGPHEPGDPDRAPATPCGSSRSRAWCSRSSPRRAAPRTTARSTAEEAPSRRGHEWIGRERIGGRRS